MESWKPSALPWDHSLYVISLAMMSVLRFASVASFPAMKGPHPYSQNSSNRGALRQKIGKGYYRYEGRVRRPDPEVTALIEEISLERGIQRRHIGDEEILARLLHPLGE